VQRARGWASRPGTRRTRGGRGTPPRPPSNPVKWILKRQLILINNTVHTTQISICHKKVLRDDKWRCYRL
jgi:hypothetical protein